MGFNIKHIKKYKWWVERHRREYKENLYWGREYARLCSNLDWALLFNKSDQIIDDTSMKKHDYILRFLKEICSNTISRYQGIISPQNLYSLNDEVKLWSMWWQGEEQADKLFRMCIDSARRHTRHDVITLSRDNYEKYCEIPEIMLHKHEEGKIRIQHMCDYLVVAILAEQGGFFTGATVWWSQDKNDEFLRTPFFTCKAETQRKYLMSRSRWVGYVMGGNKAFPLFSFVRDCLKEYWLKCDKAIDYLLMDYLIELAYQNVPCVKEMIDNIPDNNLLRNELIGVLGEKYDEEKFMRYTEGDTFLYKLSWKFGNKDEKTADGHVTNYGHMLEEYYNSGMSNTVE